MSKRRRNSKNKLRNRKKYYQKTNQKETSVSFDDPLQIGDISITEEKVSDKFIDLDGAERRPAKPLDKESKEKIKIMPQTYVEDTFNVHDNHSEEKIIKNNVTLKVKKFISKDKLLKDKSFQNKVERLKKRIYHTKGFSEILDFTTLSKMYRTFYINETTDEIDLLLNEIILHFKKRLRIVKLSYEEYQKLIAYFDSLQTLYKRFNHGEGSIKEGLKLELNKLKSAEAFIKRKLF